MLVLARFFLISEYNLAGTTSNMERQESPSLRVKHARKSYAKARPYDFLKYIVIFSPFCQNPQISSEKS